MVATLAQLLGLQKKHTEVAACLDNLGDGSLRPAVLGAIRAMVLFRAGQKDNARAAALQAMQYLNADSPETDRMRVAEALGYAGAKAESSLSGRRFWSRTCETCLSAPRWSLQERPATTRSSGTSARGSARRGARHPFTLELEVMTLEKYSAYDDAVSVMQSYVAARPGRRPGTRVPGPPVAPRPSARPAGTHRIGCLETTPR